MRGATVLEAWADAARELGTLAGLGIDLNAITEQLQADGVKSFAESYGKVLAALERKLDAIVPAQRTSGA